MLPFWISIASLSLCQGVVVALPRAWSPAWLARVHSRAWALVPPLSVIGFVAVGRLAEEASAQALTYIALVGVPLGAALALGWLMHGARPWLALLVAPLFALAWADRGGLAGEAAALGLTALSCVALGTLIGGVTPARWLALGIVAMACSDATLVISDLLQAPNNALNAAHPVGGLPQLQAEVFGSAVMGYGDLFVAGVFGGLLACLPAYAPRGVPFKVSARIPRRVSSGLSSGIEGTRDGAATVVRSRQLTGALLAALLAVAFDFLFFAVDELPATVPVAGALVILVWGSRCRGVNLLAGGRRRAGAQAPSRLPASAVAPAPARAPR
jgi:hypothetical protein